MAIQLDVQIAAEDRHIPSESEFRKWARAIRSSGADDKACLRIVDRDESRRLNSRYGKQDKATNVLSFPASIPEEFGIGFLGDVVICAPVVVEEAAMQGKDIRSHWAHLLVHGLLHLQGHVHDNDQQAQEMEALEIDILHRLGVENPY